MVWSRQHPEELEKALRMIELTRHECRHLEYALRSCADHLVYIIEEAEGLDIILEDDLIEEINQAREIIAMALEKQA